MQQLIYFELILSVLELLNNQPDHPNKFEYAELFNFFKTLIPERASNQVLERQFSNPCKKTHCLLKGCWRSLTCHSTTLYQKNQRTYVDSVLSGQPVVNREAIVVSFAELVYPIHFFDFEAQNPTIPRFDGLKPHEQFPFQNSCHVLHEDGQVEHREYLHTDISDLRPSLVAALANEIAPTGSVVVYHQFFEASCGSWLKPFLAVRFS